MKKLTGSFTVALIFLFNSLGLAQATRPPMLQDIQVPSNAQANEVPSATPSLIQKTGSALPVTRTPGVRTMFPVLADVSIPGYSGVLVESLEGNVVIESNSTFAFNPASNVKIATAFAVLKTFGPEFRFTTNVYTDGSLDRATGTLHGNVYMSGKDPIFGYEHAVTVANELNRMGVRTVTGDLIITDNFVMNYAQSPHVGGQTLFSTMDASKRNPAATRVWLNHLSYSGKFGKVPHVPSVSFNGSLYVQPIPTNLQLLFTHESAQIKEVLKATLCYSNNFMSERLGDLLGGPFAVARVVHLNAGINPAEFSIQTASGLGINRVTPNAMMKLLRALRTDLARYKLTFADIMPVAGIDKGTLEGRFGSEYSKGSIVGKTGTLGRTDGGVSALAGEVNTRNGKMLFVIFNQRGSVSHFRAFQNSFVSIVQGQLGGAVPIKYDAMSLDTRLAKTRITYPEARAAGN